MISFLSSVAYSAAELADKWLPLPTKLSQTLELKRHWKDEIAPDSINSKSPSLWVHGASVGELEDLSSFFLDQRLLEIAGYKAQDVMITASSPSAIPVLKKWKKSHGFRYAYLLPPEKKEDVALFFKKLNPELLVLSQSDVWPLLFKKAKDELKKGAIWIPHKQNSARLWKSSHLKYFVKTVATREQINIPLIENTHQIFIGNPRIDRIVDRIENSKINSTPHPLVNQGFQFKADENKIHILLASIWKEDARIWESALRILSPENRARLSIASVPHEPDNIVELSHINALAENKWSNFSIKGQLLESYAQFDLCYVGGGFKTGLHSILEPAICGIPTLCGPDTRKQSDAPRLSKANTLLPFKNSQELANKLEVLINNSDILPHWKSTCLKISQAYRAELGAPQKLAEIVCRS